MPYLWKMTTLPGRTGCIFSVSLEARHYEPLLSLHVISPDSLLTNKSAIEAIGEGIRIYFLSIVGSRNMEYEGRHAPCFYSLQHIQRELPQLLRNLLNREKSKMYRLHTSPVTIFLSLRHKYPDKASNRDGCSSQHNDNHKYPEPRQASRVRRSTRLQRGYKQRNQDSERNNQQGQAANNYKGRKNNTPQT